MGDKTQWIRIRTGDILRTRLWKLRRVQNVDVNPGRWNCINSVRSVGLKSGSPNGTDLLTNIPYLDELVERGEKLDLLVDKM